MYKRILIFIGILVISSVSLSLVGKGASVAYSTIEKSAVLPKLAKEDKIDQPQIAIINTSDEVVTQEIIEAQPFLPLVFDDSEITAKSYLITL